jgi:hypothetical protein
MSDGLSLVQLGGVMGVVAPAAQPGQPLIYAPTGQPHMHSGMIKTLRLLFIKLSPIPVPLLLLARPLPLPFSSPSPPETRCFRSWHLGLLQRIPLIRSLAMPGSTCAAHVGKNIDTDKKLDTVMPRSTCAAHINFNSSHMYVYIQIYTHTFIHIA